MEIGIILSDDLIETIGIKVIRIREKQILKKKYNNVVKEINKINYLILYHIMQPYNNWFINKIRRPRDYIEIRQYINREYQDQHRRPKERPNLNRNMYIYMVYIQIYTNLKRISF